jgi:hypothetical protein
MIMICGVLSLIRKYSSDKTTSRSEQNNPQSFQHHQLESQNFHIPVSITFVRGGSALIRGVHFFHALPYTFQFNFFSTSKLRFAPTEYACFYYFSLDFFLSYMKKPIKLKERKAHYDRKRKRALSEKELNDGEKVLETRASRIKIFKLFIFGRWS